MSDNKESSDVKIRRFLYLNCFYTRYVAGDPEIHQCYQPQNSKEFLEQFEDHQKVKQFSLSINDIDVPKRENLFFVLACLSSMSGLPNGVRHDLFTVALNNFKSDKDVFTYVDFSKRLKKTFSTGIQKIVTAHYKKKEPKRLVRDFCSRKSYRSWKHKDVIKLCHIRPDDVVSRVAFTYACKGIGEAEAIANENPAALELVQYMKKFDAFKSASSVTDIEQVIQEIDFEYENIPKDLQDKEKVWSVLLPKLNTKELIHHLVKMHKRGLLKIGDEFINKVVKCLTNKEKILECQIHPLEVYLGLRLFEKGGKPRDIKLIKYLEEKEDCVAKAASNENYEKPDFAHIEPIKCKPISHALIKDTLRMSFQNVPKTGKSFLITISAEADMDGPCLSSKYLSCLEAAAVLTLSFLNAEDNVVVAVFNETTITRVKIDKASNVTTCIKKLRTVEHGNIQNGAPFVWASSTAKKFDVFINMYNEMPMGFNDSKKPNNNPFVQLDKYKSDMKMTDVKLLFMNLGKFRATAFDVQSVLDIRGIDDSIPKVIYAFIKNLF